MPVVTLSAILTAFGARREVILIGNATAVVGAVSTIVPIIVLAILPLATNSTATTQVVIIARMLTSSPSVSTRRSFPAAAVRGRAPLPRSGCGGKRKISLFSLLKFFGLCPFSPKKKLSLSQKQESGVLLLSLIVSSLLSLSEENKSNLFTFILSRPARVSRSFIKECLYIRRTLLSLLYYSYQGTEERERAESANTLSL